MGEFGIREDETIDSAFSDQPVALIQSNGITPVEGIGNDFKLIQMMLESTNVPRSPCFR